MYGLADRIARSVTASPGLAPVIPLAAAGTVMVVDRDPAMLALVRAALEDRYRIVVARDAGEALAQIAWARPGAVIADAGLAAEELDLLDRGLATLGCDAVPVVLLDPAQPLGPADLRRIADRALAVGRRVWMTSGLRERIAA